MITALANGIIGVLLSFYIGYTYLDLNLADISACLLAANIAALGSLLVTLKAEKYAWIRKHLLTRAAKAWAFLLVLFFGVLLGLTPVLRETRTLLYLFVPLTLSTGFAILFFGPLQDYFVRRAQKKAKKRKTIPDPVKNDFPCLPTDSAML